MKIYDFNGRKNICRQKVREERLKRNMKQKELAAQMHLRGVVLDDTAISKIESGDRFVTDYEVKVLADIFGITTDELLGN